jgi:hypothetical protein
MPEAPRNTEVFMDRDEPIEFARLPEWYVFTTICVEETWRATAFSFELHAMRAHRCKVNSFAMQTMPFERCR